MDAEPFLKASTWLTVPTTWWRTLPRPSPKVAVSLASTGLRQLHTCLGAAGRTRCGPRWASMDVPVVGSTSEGRHAIPLLLSQRLVERAPHMDAAEGTMIPLTPSEAAPHDLPAPTHKPRHRRA